MKEGGGNPAGVKALVHVIKVTVHPDHLEVQYRVDGHSDGPEGTVHNFGDPTGIRTRVTAVKGRCLRPLDHGAGKDESGGPTRDRTWDRPVMSRLLYR